MFLELKGLTGGRRVRMHVFFGRDLGSLDSIVRNGTTG